MYISTIYSLSLQDYCSVFRIVFDVGLCHLVLFAVKYLVKGSVLMPRKGENIYKRKDGRWEARYILCYENGRPKYRYLYGGSYTEVKAKRQEEMKKTNTIMTSSVKQLAGIEELCALWLLSKESKVRESTFTRYDRTVRKYILVCFGKQRIVKISSAEIIRFYEALKERLSDKTVSDIMCVFKSIWRYGTENGFPCCACSFPNEKVRKKNHITIVPPEARRKIETALMAQDDLVSLGIVITLFTGVRIGEICGLQWGDIDFDNGYMYIRRTIERIADLDEKTERKTKVIISEPKTENSVRIIPLPSFLTDYIRKYRMSDDIYILTASTKHTEPSTYYSRYKTFLRRNDLGDFTFHELRHTFATDCVEKGFDIKSLSEILGHSNVATTMCFYVHPTLQMKKRQMEKLSLSS